MRGGKGQSKGHGPVGAGPGGNSKANKKHFRPYHSINVPRRVDLETEVDLSEVTTIMLRNIPNRYTQTSLIEEINGVGFEGRYDFFYLPMDVHNRTNVGYAFINFVTPKDAQAFLTEFGNYMFKRHSSHKIAGVSPAHMQGLIKNIQHFLPRAVSQSRDACYRPAVFLNGRRLELQEALEELQAPQMPKSSPAPPPGEFLHLPPGISVDPSEVPTKAAPGLSLPYEAGFVRGVSNASTAAEANLSGFLRVTSEGSTASELNAWASAFVPSEPVVECETWKDEAFVGARCAFENALSQLLQDPVALKPREKLESKTTVGDSRTGTPRSSGSSADERSTNSVAPAPADRAPGRKPTPPLGETASEDVTPRTDKRLLGLNFSLTTC